MGGVRGTVHRAVEGNRPMLVARAYDFNLRGPRGRDRRARRWFTSVLAVLRCHGKKLSKALSDLSVSGGPPRREGSNCQKQQDCCGSQAIREQFFGAGRVLVGRLAAEIGVVFTRATQDSRESVRRRIRKHPRGWRGARRRP